MTQPAQLPETEAAHPSQYKSCYLHAGQIYFDRAPTIVTTIVGSCVAVCMWDRTSGIGGVNHYLLASAPSEKAPIGRFGNTAIPELIERIVKLGAKKVNLQAKIFGGACVMPTLKSAGSGALGLRNVEIAQQMLSSIGIPIIASDVGGSRGRKVIFHTDNGTAWVKHL